MHRSRLTTVLLSTAALFLLLGRPVGAQPAPAPACLQPGVALTFYDLTSGEAQYLTGQFPFRNSGPGELFSSITPDQIVVVPQVNFVAKGISKIDSLSDTLSAWPHAFPAAGTVVLFDTTLAVPYNGFWTFFVSTSDPMELTLSQNGNAFEVLKTGDELEIINSTVEGTTQEVQYNLSKGSYQLHCEWHHGLSGARVSKPLLVLEWTYGANPATVPSPSAPEIPREVIPARYLSTSCLAKNVTGPAAAAPLFSPPPPGPQAAVTTGSLPSLSLPSSPPPPADPKQPPPPAPRPPPPPSAPAAATCSAAYSSMGPYVQGEGYAAVVTVYLTAATPETVPYNFSIGSPNYTGLTDVFNWQVDGPITGSTFQGVVTASWENLPATSPVSLGGRFSSNSDNIQDYNPSVVTVNGQPCLLSPK